MKNLKKVTVLITGGTGFIGSHLIDKCKKKRMEYNFNISQQ